MDGARRTLISQPKKKRRRKYLQTHNRLESGGGGVASFFSVACASFPPCFLLPSPLCADVTSGTRAAASAALVARNAQLASARIASAAAAGTAALNGVQGWLRLCAPYVRNTFRAINGFLAVAICANSWKVAPERPQRPPVPYSWRGLVHNNHTRCAESCNGCIQRIYAPPSDPEIRHAAPAAVPAANFGPGTGNSPRAGSNHPRRAYGRNSTGGWPADNPQRVPPRPRMCGGVCVCVQGELPESGRGAGRPVGPGPTRPFPRFTPVPEHVPEAAIGGLKSAEEANVTA
jgi:hypothetical protein